MTGSTNTDLVEAALAGAPDGTVLRADHQTAGRGRLDRRWEAPAGANLLVSVLFRRTDARAHSLVRAVAVAARRAARSLGVDAGLKWPNDLVVDDAKLGGILAQTVPGAAGAIVVGLGVNVGWAPEGATSLSDHCPSVVSPHDLLLVVLDELAEALTLDVVDLDEEYRASLVTLGRRVRVELPGGDEVVGRAVAVGVDGRLSVRSDTGEMSTFDTGDIIHLRNDV